MSSFDPLDRSEFRPLNRFAARLFIAAILVGSSASGFLMGRLLLAFGVESMPLRYLAGGIAAYGCFLLLSTLWLRSLAEMRPYVAPKPSRGTSEGLEAAIEMGAEAPSFFDGFDFSIGDADDLIGFLLGGIVLAFGLIVLGGAAYVLLDLPFLFLEGVLYGLLSTVLFKTARNLGDPDWTGGLIKKTGWVFALMLAIWCFIGYAAQSHCPSALTLKRALVCEEGRR